MKLSVFPLLPALVVLAGAPIATAQAASVPSPAPKRAPAPAVSSAKLQKQADLVVRCVSQRALPRSITPKQRAALFQVVRQARAGNLSQVEAKWAEFVRGIATGGVTPDINALVQWLLREAYMETNKDLQFYADKVRYYNQLKKSIRNEVTRVRNTMSGLKQAQPAPVSTLNIKPYRRYAPATTTSAPKPMTKRDLENYIKELEEKLSTVGDDAQLANINLQNKLQQMQQTLQTMSTMSKTLHDAAMAIIRKIG